MNAVFAIVGGYVLGSFPSAYLTGRALKGVDLRRVGSGNLGATNVYREVGAGAAAVVLALDAAKGWLAAAVLPAVVGAPPLEWIAVAAGIAAVVGHAKPVFLLGRGGGKGVATTGGVFLALAPAAVGLATLAFAAAVALTRFVSAGSLVAAVVLPIAVAMLHGVRTPTFAASVVLASLVAWLHRGNVSRIMSGTERRIGRPGAAA